MDVSISVVRTCQSSRRVVTTIADCAVSETLPQSEDPRPAIKAPMKWRLAWSELSKVTSQIIAYMLLFFAFMPLSNLDLAQTDHV